MPIFKCIQTVITTKEFFVEAVDKAEAIHKLEQSLKDYSGSCFMVEGGIIPGQSTTESSLGQLTIPTADEAVRALLEHCQYINRLMSRGNRI